MSSKLIMLVILSILLPFFSAGRTSCLYMSKKRLHIASTNEISLESFNLYLLQLSIISFVSVLVETPVDSTIAPAPKITVILCSITYTFPFCIFYFDFCSLKIYDNRFKYDYCGNVRSLAAVRIPGI